MKALLLASASSLCLAFLPAARVAASPAQDAPGASGQPAPVVQDAGISGGASDQAQITRYCVGCHNSRVKTGNFVLEGLEIARAGEHPEMWEKVVRKLRGGLMPPAGRPRPDDAAYRRLRTSIESRLDQAASARPDPGRTEIAHRLNRLEYANAIRDLLAVEINAPDLLPADDSSYGFDNMAGVLKMSPALMERYLGAARLISRIAVGSPPPAVNAAVYRVSGEVQQHERIDPLPFGTRGGTLVRHLFPLDAEYDLKVTIAAGRAAADRHQLEITLDGERIQLFTVGGREQPEVRVAVKGGPHDVGVAFLRTTPDLVEHVREPFLNPDAPSGTGGQAGALPGVASLTIAGPFNAAGPGDTPSRRRLFVCTPTSPADETRCAKTILSTLARRAYRGTVTTEQLEILTRFYEQGRTGSGGFEAGIEFAVRRLLVSPEFLYRVEADPAAAANATRGVYRINDFELASRLSFFLWSSIPDDGLLDAAANGGLRTTAGLDAQVRRLLADPRSATLTRNFGGQWLLTRNLATSRPGETYALAFDDTLRHAMQRETELLLESVVRENRSAIELLTADYTFLNERLAQHYGVPNIQGSHFRRVPLPADNPRRGLLGHGSILTVTSPAIRTSPVIRGKWILDNVLGVPPPDPPPDVPALSDRRTQRKVKTMRERMAQHRANPVCSTCHSMIDPPGFALENFDAIGRWRAVDESFNAIDASGALPDGSAFNGVHELRTALTRHPERFAHTVTEKLMTYALGRGMEPYDMPAIRKILRDTAPGGYRMQAIIEAIVKSYPFQYRRSQAAGADASVATR